jgi:ferric-dicitrate binding protein FerR (iron transport regulator)
VAAGELDTQALNWLVRSEAPDCTDAERTQLAAWLETPRHRAAYIRMRAVWAQADQLRRLQPLDGNVNPDLLEPGSLLTGRELQSHRAPRSHTPLVAYILAAVLLTVLVSGITAWIVSEKLLRPLIAP